MYAVAPDDAFALGPLGGTSKVVLACGFSPHGFKSVPVVGEVVADLVQTGTTPHDIALFDVARPLRRHVYELTTHPARAATPPRRRVAL